MKKIISTIGGAAVALSLVTAMPAMAVGNGNAPAATGDLAAKPKEPSKKIVKKTYYPNGTIKSTTTCTGAGQQYCD